MEEEVDEECRGDQREEEGCEGKGTAGEDRARKSGPSFAVWSSCGLRLHECR